MVIPKLDRQLRLRNKFFVLTPWGLSITMAFLQLGDFLTTSYLLTHHGGTEANPFLWFVNGPNGILWLALTKVFAAILFGVACMWSLNKEPHRHWVFRLCILAYVVLISWNLGMIYVSSA